MEGKQEERQEGKKLNTEIVLGVQQSLTSRDTNHTPLLVNIRPPRHQILSEGDDDSKNDRYLQQRHLSGPPVVVDR